MSVVPDDLPEPSGGIGDLLAYHPVAHAGGYADTLLYEADSVRRLPEGVSLEEGAMTDTLGVGLAAVRRVGVEIGASVLVIGAGPIGLVSLMAARLAGAGQIIVTDMSETRRAAARRHGADLVLDPAEADVQQQLMSLTDGAGMDVVFECAGVPSTIQESVNLVKRSGRVGLVGVCFEPAQIMPAIWYIKDVTVIVIPGADLLASLNVMARKLVDVTPLISHVVPLDDIQESFDALLRPTDQLKILVKP
jgi:(R,R)-butanediol dehydrogenase/meso-butanediol dehydrogenase/diacetyl reductase